MMDATTLLSRFVAELRYEDLPEEAVEQTKLYIADYLASSAAGEKVNAAFNNAIWQIVTASGGAQDATVLHRAQRLPVEQAAFMNAVFAHGADMDDGNRKAMGHVAAHVMSAVFALAETMPGITWREVLTAINAGYEIYNRVAAAAQPGLVHRGFHSTGTAGVIACAAASAKLMGMDAESTYRAMAIAAIQASGLIIIAESGQSCKPLNPANAARIGILSARLASAGVDGPRNPLESTKGWFHAMTDQVNEEMLTDGLGTTFTICESYLKPYPSCRHTHCGIDAGRVIRSRVLEKQGALREADIAEVVVNTYRNAIQIAGQITVPQKMDDAKFSVHYALAVTLLTGYFGLDDLLVPEEDSEVVRLIGKIRLVEDPSMEDVKRGIRGAGVTVVLRDGTSYTETVTIPKGDAANPMSWADMEAKMRACLSGLCDAKKSGEVIARIRAIAPADAYAPACLLLPELV